MNEKTRVVVGGWPNSCPTGVSHQRQNSKKRWNEALCALLAMILCCIAMMWITPVGNADEGTGTGITVTENITDTENLLGSNVAEITDAISKTKQETGVTVRLLYLASFNSDEKPAKWASALLESLDPKPNTVLLAVASNDGNLVVAVSSNSDEWLKTKSTVDALSDAAQKPLMESTPNWSKSATDMMDQIVVQKKTSTSSQTVLLGVGGMIAVLVLLIVVMVVFHILRKRGVIKRKVRKHAGKHAEAAVRSEPVKAWSVDDELSADAPDKEPTPKEDSESVQETSSEKSDA